MDEPTRPGPTGDEAPRTDDTADEAARAAAALTDVTEHLRLALEAGDLGTWRWDMASGAVVWDERLERIFGLEPGTFDGSFEMYVGLLHPDDKDLVLSAVDAAVEAADSYQVDHRIVWPDGSVHWIQGRGKVTIDEFGAVTGTIGCSVDITPRKVAEEEAENRAAMAARRAERERRQRERLEFLADITQASVAAPTHREFMASVVGAAVPGLGEWCSLYFLPDDAQRPEFRAAHADPERSRWAEALLDQYPFDPAARSGVPEVMRTAQPEFVPDGEDEVLQKLARSTVAPSEVADLLRPLHLTSLITVPLTTKRGVVGAMQFASGESGRQYDGDDLALARAVAGRVAEALENIWLTDQHRQISATLQRSLLPPALPAVSGVEVAARYWPAGAVTEVGGDFYDLFPLATGRWAILIGDVCGTGANAAAVSGIVRHTVRAAARHGQDHESVIEWINEAVQESGRHLFCTACFATLEATDGEFRLVTTSGGHPLPIVVRPSGETTTLGKPGTLLGVFDDVVTRPAEVALRPGDVVVFYTDGLNELPPPYGLTAEEVADLMTDLAPSGSAEDIADAIERSLNGRLPEGERHDDIALIVLRIGVPAAPTP